MAEAKDTVNTQCAAYRQMSAKWTLLHDLLGGTSAMRSAGERWLPREQDEKDLNYKARLGRSILFGGYGDTVEKLAAKPFSKPVTIQGELPEQLAPMSNDVDGSGYSLTQFGQDVFRSALKYGLTHVLVDYPKVEGSPDLGTERQLALRPRFVLVEPPQLIGWTFDKAANGQPVLTSIRIREQECRKEGTFGDKIVQQIRVYTTDHWELWEQPEKEWVKVGEGVHTFGGIPLATCYFQRSGLMTADPPLEDLAWLNLAHWQSMSDQRNILRFARFALLFAKGFKDNEVEKGFSVGPSNVISTTNPEADLKYVEHTGSAIDAGEEDIKRVEQRMEVLSMQPLIRQSGDVKATGMAINESKSQSEIQAWIRNLEAGIRQSFDLACRWIGAELPDDFKVDIFNEFNLVLGASSDTGELLKVWQGNGITHETYLREVKRRGLLSENLDVDQEVENVKAQGPALAGIGAGGGAGAGGADAGSEQPVLE